MAVTKDAIDLDLDLEHSITRMLWFSFWVGPACFSVFLDAQSQSSSLDETVGESTACRSALNLTPACSVSHTSVERFLSVWQAKEVKWKNCSSAQCSHIAREESSRSGTHQPHSGIFVVVVLLCSSLSRSCSLHPHTFRLGKFFKLPLSPHSLQLHCCFPTQAIYPGWGHTRNREHLPLQDGGERIWPHQHSGLPLAVTLWPGWTTSIQGLLLTVKPEERGTNTHKYTLNNGNTGLKITNQSLVWPPPFSCSWWLLFCVTVPHHHP